MLDTRLCYLYSLLFPRFRNTPRPAVESPYRTLKIHTWAVIIITVRNPLHETRQTLTRVVLRT